MRRRPGTVRGALALATASIALVSAGGLAFPSMLSAQDASSRPVVVVVGESTVQRPPDVAFMTLATESRARSPRDAQRQSAAAMAGVYQRLGALGLGRDVVRTVAYDVQQAFDVTPEGRRAPRDWVARNVVEVRLDAVDRAGEIVDQAVQGGATSVEGIRFDLRDRAAAERDAVRQAVIDARGRADAAAAGAGQTIDRVVRIEDSRQPMAAMPRMAMLGAARAEVTTPIESGVISIDARVLVTFSLRP